MFFSFFFFRFFQVFPVFFPQFFSAFLSFFSQTIFRLRVTKLYRREAEGGGGIRHNGVAPGGGCAGKPDLAILSSMSFRTRDGRGGGAYARMVSHPGDDTRGNRIWRFYLV